MPPDRTLRSVAEAGSSWSRAARDEEKRRAMRDEAIRAAAAAGASHAAIADAAGLERSHVTRILLGARGSRAAKAIRPTR